MQKKITRTCNTCGIAFELPVWAGPTKERPRQGLYCSRDCKNKGVSKRVSRPLGGKCISNSGYVMVRVERAWDHGKRKQTSGYKAEHRIIVEAEIGRKLTKDEQVHHKNGNKQDNSPENLELLTNSEHQRKHGNAITQRGSRIDKVCRECGKDYQVKMSKVAESKYCCNACRLTALHRGLKKVSS